MAGDWIKMRVWLSRDPRVITMADYLIKTPAFVSASGLSSPLSQPHLSNVMRNVTVALCVNGLLVTWGTAREQGDRENDDLVLTHTRLCTLDAMCDVPGFGDALAFVGWAFEREDGAVVFPKFFRENESPDERHKRQNAERQARYRDKQSRESNASDNVTNNVTVTTEKRRGEINTKPAAFDPLAHLRTLGITDTVAADWLALRKTKKAKVTETAIAGIKREADKAGISLQAALEKCCQNGWQGFNAEWVGKQPAAQPGKFTV